MQQDRDLLKVGGSPFFVPNERVRVEALQAGALAAMLRLVIFVLLLAAVGQASAKNPASGGVVLVLVTVHQIHYGAGEVPADKGNGERRYNGYGAPASPSSAGGTRAGAPLLLRSS